MRLFSLFSGIGGFDLAFQCVGAEIVGACEIDKWARAIYRYHFPDVRVWHNATIVDTRELPEFDILTAGSPCFGVGTLVLTYRGYIPIESVKIGDLVLTHKCRWQPVTSVMKHEDAELREVKAGGCHSLITTDEHPFLTKSRSKEWSTNPRGYRRIFSDPEWTYAKSLTKDHFVGQVIPCNVGHTSFSCAFWWVVGRYLADGWLVDRKDRKDSGRVVFACPDVKSDVLILQLAKAGYHWYKTHEPTCPKYHVVNVELYRFLKQFGRHSYDKTLPSFVYELPLKYSKALFSGYLAGDGHYHKKHKSWNFTTVSSKLAYSMALLAQKVYGVVASISFREPAQTTEIQGRIVNQRDQYEVRIPQRNKVQFIEGKYGWKQIKSNEPCGRKGAVYNLSVQSDESYITNGLIVHNCPDFSIAGKRKGLEGIRGTLFYEIIRFLRDKRPRYFLFENVHGLLSSGNYKDFPQVLECFTDSGYELQWSMVNSSWHGSAQNRNRLFIVGNLTGKCRPEVFSFGKSDTDDFGQVEKGLQAAHTITTRNLIYKVSRGNNVGGLFNADKHPTMTASKQQHNVLLQHCGSQYDGIRFRRLTEIERERLQKFPDYWTKYGIDDDGNKIEISETQRCAALGRAVTVSVVYQIAKRMVENIENND